MAITTTDLTGHTDDSSLVDGKIVNYVTQINTGNTVHDIATHHSITFKDGDSTLTWNGLEDIEVDISGSGETTSGSYELVLDDEGSLSCVKNGTDEGFVLSEAGSLDLA